MWQNAVHSIHKYVLKYKSEICKRNKYKILKND